MVYEIVKPLGKGGRGEVFLVRNPATGGFSALKRLTGGNDPASVALFKAEAEILIRLSHPNLVRIENFLEGPPPAYVMEYVDGLPLDAALKKADAETVLKTFVDACRALHALHSRGILHRDLKPANILVSKNGETKLLDFGLPGLGTPAYWPAEAKAGRYDAQSDLYALGVSFSEALGDRLRALPEDFRKILDRLLRAEPSERFATALGPVKYLNLHRKSPFPLTTDETSSTLLQKPPWVTRPEEAALREAEDEARVIVVTGPTGSGRSRLLEEALWRLKLRGREGRIFADLHRASLSERRRIDLEIRHLWKAASRPLLLLDYDADLAGMETKTWLAERSKELGAKTVVLKDLPRARALELVLKATEEDPLPRAEAERIVREAGGRPLLLVEALRHYRRGRKDAKDFAVPKNLKEAAAARIDSLARETAWLFALLIAETGKATASELRKAWDGTPAALAEAELELMEAGLVTSPLSEEGRHHLRLAHPSLQSAYEAAIGGEGLALAHRAWLNVLTLEFSKPSAGPQAARVVRHAAAQGDPKGGEIVRAWMLPAMEYAFGGNRFEETLRLTDLLLPFARTGRERAMVLGHRAPALYRLARYDDALKTYDDWFAAKGDDETKIEAVKHNLHTGMTFLAAERTEEALERFSRCLETGDSKAHPSLRPYHARAHGFLAKLFDRAGDRETAAAHLKEALPLARGVPLLEGEIENQSGLLDQGAGRYDAAESSFRKAAGLFAEAKNPQTEAIAWNHLGMLHRETGRLQKAREDMDRAVALSRQGGEVLQTARYRDNRALVLQELGLAGEAAKDLEAAEDALLAYGEESDRSLAERIRKDFKNFRVHDFARELKPEEADARRGPRFEAWTKIRRFLESDADASEDDLAEAAFAAAAPESPYHRAVLFDLLAERMDKRGFQKLASRLRDRADRERILIHQGLPEELKMDFDKKRPIAELEKILSDAPPRSAASSGGIAPGRFRLFSDLSRKVASMTDLGKLLEEVLDAAILITGAERGLLVLKDGRSSKDTPLPGFDVAAARRLQKKSLADDELKPSLTAVKKAMESAATIVTDDAQLDPRFREKKSVVTQGLKAIAAVPLELDGEAVGAIYLDHRFQPGLFGEEDVMLLNAFAIQAAIAVQKARTIQELKLAKERLEAKVDAQAKKIAETSKGSSAVLSRGALRHGYDEIIGQSDPMMKVLERLDHVSETAIPVWILGESGTGKELVARLLHTNSPRKNAPFVAENVGAIPETLLESELFGHKKGAFTHAERDRIGLFEQASGGTLFLDEVADMSLAMQAKLLRVLQEGEVRPLGATKTVKVNVRLVTASNKDLTEMVRQGKFRQDLLFRINGLTLRLPPLRERKGDIPLLVDHLTDKIARGFGLPKAALDDGVLDLFLSYDWPGNVRELEAVMRNLLLFAKGRPVTRDLIDLHPDLFPRASLASSPEGASMAIESADEQGKIFEALRRNRLDKQKTAEDLGISIRTLYLKLDRLGIPTKKKVLSRMLGVAG